MLIGLSPHPNPLPRGEREISFCGVDDLLEGRRFGFGGDGIVEVGDEARDAAAQEGEVAQGRGMIHGVRPRGPHGVHVVEGVQVSGREAQVENYAPEGVGKQTLGTMGIMPMDGGGGGSVAGRTTKAVGGVCGVAKGQVDVGAVEEVVAALPVMGYGSDGGPPWVVFYIDKQDERDVGSGLARAHGLACGTGGDVHPTRITTYGWRFVLGSSKGGPSAGSI